MIGILTIKPAPGFRVKWPSMLLFLTETLMQGFWTNFTTQPGSILEYSRTSRLNDSTPEQLINSASEQLINPTPEQLINSASEQLINSTPEHLNIYITSNFLPTSPAIFSPIAKQEVAAGEGALHTLIAYSFS